MNSNNNSDKPLTPDIVGKTPIVEPTVTPSSEPEKVEFSPAQQAKLEEIIKAATGRTASDLRKQLAKTEAELAAAKAERDRAEAAARPDASVDEKLALELDTERRKNAELTQTLRNREREAAIRAAARNAHFIDENDALKLVDIPDDADAETIRTTVDSFAQNPARFHLIRGTAKSGSGSGPSSGYTTTPTYTVEQLFGKGSNSALANKIGIQRPDLYKSLKAEAKRKGLVA
jgi:hypothetical protein